MYDIIIVGAGPSGLTSAIYARRNNKKVLVLEKSTYGGQIINTLDIENYPGEANISGVDFANKLYNQAKNLGSDIKFETVINIKNLKDYKEIATNKNTYKCKSIILATGTRNRDLGIPKEKDFLGKGISYCATCDGAFYKNKNVCVIGSGNVAVEDALYLSEIVNKVYLVIRGETLKAEESSVMELKNKKNIEVIKNSSVTEIIGNDRLEGIIINNDNKLNIEGLFIAIGRIPENDCYKDLIDVDKYGYIESNENCHTNIPGIFVAGDNRKKELRQLVTATSDGAIAATEAIKYVNKI